MKAIPKIPMHARTSSIPRTGLKLSITGRTPVWTALHGIEQTYFPFQADRIQCLENLFKIPLFYAIFCKINKNMPKAMSKAATAFISNFSAALFANFALIFPVIAAPIPTIVAAIKSTFPYLA